MKQKTVIKVQGHIDKKWQNWFDGFQFSYDKNDTILYGSIVDNSLMYGTLNKLRDLNMRLISVNPAK